MYRVFFVVAILTIIYVCQQEIRSDSFSHEILQPETRLVAFLSFSKIS